MFKHIYNIKNNAEVFFKNLFRSRPSLLWTMILIYTSCTLNNTTMKNNPLLCNPETGICEIPSTETTTGSPSPAPASESAIRIVYFTDPICSSCWGVEAQLKKLKLEYGPWITIDYRMGGLLPGWDTYKSGGISQPSDVAKHWDEASHHYQMPIDGDVWLEDPLSSSYPPSIAFKAAQLQDHDKAIAFLRYLREALFLEKQNITRWEVMEKAGKKAGLDTEILHRDFDHAGRSLFEQDLLLARQMGVRGFPTFFIFGSDNNEQLLYGARPYEDFEKALLKARPDLTKQTYSPEWRYLFEHFPSLTAKEFSVLTNSGMKQAEKELDELHKQGKLSKTTSKNGHLWTIIP